MDILPEYAKEPLWNEIARVYSKKDADKPGGSLSQIMKERVLQRKWEEYRDKLVSGI